MNMIATMTTQRGIPDDRNALCPDNNGYPRLIRYDLPWSDFGLVSALDVDQNLLRVNRELFDQLSALQRHMVIVTRREFVYVRDL